MPKLITLIEAVEIYTGKEVEELRRYDDPVFRHTVSMRVKLRNVRGSIDFLYAPNPLEDASARTPKEVADGLEECMFETWPPKSSSDNVGR